MSEDASQVGLPPHPFELRNCPWCDYSLATLPSEGICPECGARYSSRFIVLLGKGRGRFDQLLGGTWRPWVWSGFWVIYVYSTQGRRGRSWSDPGMLVFEVMIALSFIPLVYALLFSVRSPRLQLWLAR